MRRWEFLATHLNTRIPGVPRDAPGTPGLEVISQYFTDIKSEDTFATDSNGRLMISRKRNYRPTWKLNLTEPVSSNVTL